MIQAVNTKILAGILAVLLVIAGYFGMRKSDTSSSGPAPAPKIVVQVEPSDKPAYVITPAMRQKNSIDAAATTSAIRKGFTPQ